MYKYLATFSSEKYERKGINTRLSKDDPGNDEIHEAETLLGEESAYKKTESKTESEGIYKVVF